MSGGRLILILGDQLDRRSPVLAACDPKRDRLLMIEARRESQRVPSHQARSGLFLAAMRRHAAWLEGQGYGLDYVRIDQPEATGFGEGLSAAIRRHEPRQLLMLEAGEYGVQREIEQCCADNRLALEVLEDPHFLCSRAQFAAWRDGRKSLVMEHFYRYLRKDRDILMDGSEPAGGSWNFDRQNRKAFGRAGPGSVPAPPSFAPDAMTRGALDDVQRLFRDHPGRLDAFAWPVSREQALELLGDFVDYRLVGFGAYQDAMWTDQPLLYHSGLSAALNLKLLDPREVIEAAVTAYEAGRAPLASVEGFVRQILGWREYVRGVYWSEMPDYLERNGLGAELALPDLYWSGDTDMACLRSVIGQTLALGYAHHIQRLMVTGLFALLLGVRPQAVHEWYLAVYVDAVEWVEAPNTLGMSQHADGGLLASKPYAASGRYIQRMSNYCRGCRYAPERATGEDACPFTTLYWDFLHRHRERFAKHPRAAMQWRMLERLDSKELSEITKLADLLKARLTG